MDNCTRYRVRDYLRVLFPEGTNEDETHSIEAFPQLAADLFAASASLVRASGAYQYIRPSRGEKPDPFEVLPHKSPKAAKQNRRLAAAYACLMPPDLIESSELRDSVVAGSRAKFGQSARWKPEMKDYDRIQALWTQLVECTAPVHEEFERDVVLAEEYPSWWKAAVQLMIIADDAAVGVGFNPKVSHIYTGQSLFFRYAVFEDNGQPDDPATDRTSDRTRRVSTVAQMADESIVRVLPKTRTPGVGCTLRAFSHNLALLTSQGRLKTRWYATQRRPFPSVPADSEQAPRPLHVLLVPFPFRIPSRTFKRVRADQEYGYFECVQDWLPRSGQDKIIADYFELERQQSAGSPPLKNDEREALTFAQSLVDFIQELVQASAEDGKNVNAIVFPEMALTGPLFEYVADQIWQRKSNHVALEFIISGLSTRCALDHETGETQWQRGNFVGVRGVLRTEQDPDRVSPLRTNGSGRVQWDYRTERAKHHRWCIDGAQSRRYGISHHLDAGIRWWEDIPIGARYMDIFEPRAGSTATVLICEDLARIDPCQSALRAIGPNLVFALLMDGPQIRGRWPANYAGVLAEDPGSSVLTLTSLGLITRSAPTAPSNTRAVAYWRSPLKECPLELPPGGHALVASLVCSPTAEYTLDGRADHANAYRWELDEVISVRADPSARATISVNAHYT